MDNLQKIATLDTQDTMPRQKNTICVLDTTMRKKTQITYIKLVYKPTGVHLYYINVCM